MAPKAATGTSGVDSADPTFKFVFSVLKHCESIKPNWEAVATENGIGYARNAASKFKEIVRKQGLEFSNYTISDPDDPGTRGAGDEVKIPQKVKAPTTRKRKSEDQSNNTPRTSGKKKKSAPVIAKKEEEDEETVQPRLENAMEETLKPVKSEEAAEEAAAEA